MKILHVESGRHLYGGPLQVLLLLRGLRDKGVENVLVCPAGSDLAAANPQAELREIPMRGDLDMPLVARLRGIIREARPDVIHLHSRRGADWLGGLSALRLGIPVVLSRRVDNREPRLFAAAKYAMVDRIVAISQCIRRVLLDAGVAGDKVVCVPSAVPDMPVYERDREWFRDEFGVSPDCVAIGVIAQLIPRKGHRFLLDALAEVLSVHSNVRVLFFGRGDAEETIRSQIATLGLTGIVSLPGFRDDLPRVLPCLDLVVHPALREGLGVALLQAARAGLAVIASCVGGIPEAVIDGDTGVLVPPGDSGRLAGAMLRVIGDPAGARRMGERGAAHVAANFSVESMVSGNLAVYRSL